MPVAKFSPPILNINLFPIVFSLQPYKVQCQVHSFQIFINQMEHWGATSKEWYEFRGTDATRNVISFIRYKTEYEGNKLIRLDYNCS